ncbi:putative aspartic peptidase A1 family, xylanase inhibitor [Heracleum sosnowskyi]|uniref:Aspartic peptidase A1 family, xylanase inhibitor n=1 Tax=Heracleum sosnowskyi TaxID=360622 RepID=A0AAD8GPH2_9APIA|nr:putative aspartic peptidase A1 family, xylanase inhibitor [Heracleum sosnowskyi]
MSSSSFFHLALLCCLLSVSSAKTGRPSRPKGIIFPVSKDPSTLQYTTEIKQRTPLVPVKLTIDLGGQFLWTDCEKGYTTSTYSPARCKSTSCSLAKSGNCLTECYSRARPGCTNNTCTLFPDNAIASAATTGTLGSDVISVQSAFGGARVTISQFPFVCGSTSLLDKLSSGVTGMAGLGRTNVSLPSQFSNAFNLKRKFGVCLSSTSSNGGYTFRKFRLFNCTTYLYTTSH